MIIKHSNIKGNNLHVPYTWIFENDADRTSFSNCSIEDKYKLAVQEDDGNPSFWLLITTSPATWKKLGE